MTTLLRRRTPCPSRNPVGWCTLQVIRMLWCGLRERVLKAFEQEVIPHYPVVSLRVGTSDGHTAGVDATAIREALERLVAELVTVDRLEAALRSLPIDAAARTIIDGSVDGVAEPEGVVAALEVLSSGALTLALCVR